MSLQTAEAWSLFWAAQGPSSRCLAGSPELYEPLDEHWHAFGDGLPQSARVLDLGCGTGVVGRALLKRSPGIRVSGVDLAQIPISGDERLELLSNISMESLPFEPSSFDAVVSQFGYEYGDPSRTAASIYRVLVPGGRLSLLIHHPEGSLVAGMRTHRRAIEGLCGLRIQAAFFTGDSCALAERIAALKRECTNDSIIDIAERGLHQQIRHPEAGRLQVWKAVVDALAPELFMLDSLELCCVEDRSIDRLFEPLQKSFELAAPKTLHSWRGDPIAFVIEGSRRSSAP